MKNEKDLSSELKLAQETANSLLQENVALKQAVEFATAADMWVEQADGMLDYRYHEWYVDVLKAAMKTPATDRIVAGIKAEGFEEWVSSRGGRWNGTTEEALNFAKHLREGTNEQPYP